MRIAVVDHFARFVEKVSGVVKVFRDDGICLENVHSADYWNVFVDDSASVDRSVRLKAISEAGDIVVSTVSRSRVNATGTCIGSDIVCIDDYRFAVDKRVLRLHSFESHRVKFRDNFGIFGSDSVDKRIFENACDYENFAVVFYCRILEFGVKRDRKVCRKSPRSRCPDNEVHLLSFKLLEFVDEREFYIDRRRLVVVIFDLCLCKRRFAACAPVNRFFRLEKSARFNDFRELMSDAAFVFRVKSDIGMFPVSQNTDAFEAFALSIDPVHRELLALFQKLAFRHLFALRTELFGRFELDRKTVAVPAWNEGGVKPRHIFELYDKILESFIENMTVVQISVGIRRAVVKNECRFSIILLQNFGINFIFFPFFQNFDFFYRKIRLHREIGLRQIERLAVIHNKNSLLNKHKKNAEY